MKKMTIVNIVTAVAFISWVLLSSHAFGFSTKATANVKVAETTHKIVVYILYGYDNHGYKSKKVNTDDSREKVTIKVSGIDRGIPAKMCAYDARDDEKFACSKYIKLDQKKENVNIDIRDRY